MLTDKEAEEIRCGLAAGMRGPVLLKWVEQLLADRDGRWLESAQRTGPGRGLSPGLQRPRRDLLVKLRDNRVRFLPSVRLSDEAVADSIATH
jgi:hypothetical protein